jgi:aryl-alcohol dehydrogenase-like predicted oxidoreductase
MYPGSSSEEITGRALRDMAQRDEIVVATKAFFPWKTALMLVSYPQSSRAAAEEPGTGETHKERRWSVSSLTLDCRGKPDP